MQKFIDSLILSKRCKFLDKTQQKETELPIHQMESEQPHYTGVRTSISEATE